MAYYDVFNGDADGICALIQLRLAEPRDSVLVTGVKRDIALLQQVQACKGDVVTVLDIALEKNSAALQTVLAAGASVLYCDHHFPGELPTHPCLTTLINTGAEVCTSLLVSAYLRHAHAHWAVVGAFGDNLHSSAAALARSIDLEPALLEPYERLGICINYNAYGASLTDLHFTPQDLFQRLLRYQTPAAFLQADTGTFAALEAGYHDDLAMTVQATRLLETEAAAVILLPDAPWARRVSGIFGNLLVNQAPKRAHAVVTERAGQGYLVSVRAPLQNRTGADAVCRQFPGGGGRAGAAGINDLPVAQLDTFIDVFQRHYR
ncbi:MAG TPA: DHH family phosphoesterase [Thiolinea sp.]|nr:DHH family phosphoesterase [Thiolinea sp.]